MIFYTYGKKNLNFNTCTHVLMGMHLIKENELFTKHGHTIKIAHYGFNERTSDHLLVTDDICNCTSKRE